MYFSKISDSPILEQISNQLGSQFEEVHVKKILEMVAENNNLCFDPFICDEEFHYSDCSNIFGVYDLFRGEKIFNAS